MIKESPHFFHAVRNAGALKLGPTGDRDKGIRLYCEVAGISWVLQVRCPVRRSDGKDGKAFVAATAMLDLSALKALRAAIDESLQHYEQWIRED